MRIKAIILPLTVTLMLAFAATCEAGNWSLNDGRIDVGVYPPMQAYAGDTITVRVRIEALEDLLDVDVDIYLYGSTGEGYGSWSRYVSVLRDKDLSGGVVRDEDYQIAIPSDASPGLGYAIIFIHYQYYIWPSWRGVYSDYTFQMTYVKDEAYENLLSLYNQKVTQYNSLVNQYNALKNEYDTVKAERDYWKSEYENVVSSKDALEAEYTRLQTDYDSLNATYHSLLSDYNSMKAKAESSGSSMATTLNYVLALTTIGFFISTVYLAVKKSRPNQTA